MRWTELKARILAAGSAKLEGEPADEYIAKSTAGPGAGGRGAVFFRTGDHRVKLSLNPQAGIAIVHDGGGNARLLFEGREYPGQLDVPGYHCPRQAFITVSSGCIFRCRYCQVPYLKEQRRKTVDEIIAMVEAAKGRIDVIAVTSGVLQSIAEEERYVLEVVSALRRFGLPIGVTIYPLAETPARLHTLGVAEVKFNIEAATSALFSEMCPGLDRQVILDALDRSVPLFGRGHVFSNVIIGLGETDAEMEACIRALTARGVIPVLRPLNPVAGLKQYARPSAERLIRLHALLTKALNGAGLDTRQALTMCTACRGCDLVPGRDS
jgi:biotin synthase-related radical SAM superfamily protein